MKPYILAILFIAIPGSIVLGAIATIVISLYRRFKK